MRRYGPYSREARELIEDAFAAITRNLSFAEEPPSVHVIRKNGDWYCQCCAAPVPFEHICSCEEPNF